MDGDFPLVLSNVGVCAPDLCIPPLAGAAAVALLNEAGRIRAGSVEAGRCGMSPLRFERLTGDGW